MEALFSGSCPTWTCKVSKWDGAILNVKLDSMISTQLPNRDVSPFYISHPSSDLCSRAIANWKHEKCIELKISTAEKSIMRITSFFAA